MSLTVQFTDASTPTGRIADWFWDFGDGTFSTVESPLHTYAVGGTYNVTLYIIGDYGGTDHVTHSLTVTNALASFTWTWAGFDFGVQFTDTSTTDEPPIVAWAWDFGDGSTSTLQNPFHTYLQQGTYTVSLTITDSLGGMDTAHQTIPASIFPFTEYTFINSSDWTLSFAPSDCGHVGSLWSVSPPKVYDGDGVTPDRCFGVAAILTPHAGTTWLSVNEVRVRFQFNYIGGSDGVWYGLDANGVNVYNQSNIGGLFDGSYHTIIMPQSTVGTITSLKVWFWIDSGAASYPNSLNFNVVDIFGTKSP